MKTIKILLIVFALIVVSAYQQRTKQVKVVRISEYDKGLSDSIIRNTKEGWELYQVVPGATTQGYTTYFYLIFKK